ncbi:MAG: DNRLRE domain-containing protein [Cellulomonadaceae bacterium]|nr:DNRLRE domain-containing protein [Cellulomonadaceae bacterium]
MTWDRTVTKWFDNSFTDYEIERLPWEDRNTLRVGGSGDAFSFMHVTLGSDFFADEITDAALHLKLVDGVAPAQMNVALVDKVWSVPSATFTDSQAKVAQATVESVPVSEEADNWVTVPVTAEVKDWLSGDYRNYGFALLPAPNSELAVFDSETAYLEVSGQELPRATTYNKFGYLQQPPAGVDFTESGNCMAFALRDIDMILLEDMHMDYGELNRIYFEDGGENAVLEYVAAKVEAYVADHSDGLEISSFRKLEDFDSPIDPATEYRIAMRISAYATEDLLMQQAGGFDYHFWIQLPDGRWAQKFPLSDSLIIPGTAGDVSPAKFPWDASSEGWGSEKTTDQYQSPVLYYAVTKDVPRLTAHRTGRTLD